MDVASQKQRVENNGGFSTFALPRGFQNELDSIFRAGSSIYSDLVRLYNNVPTSGGDLREAIREVSQFVMVQDKWIVLRIDSLAAVVAEYNTRITNISSRADWLNTKIDNNRASNDSSTRSLQNQINELDSWLNTKIDNNRKSNDSSISSLQQQITDNKNSDTATKNSLQNQVTDNKKSADSSVTSLQNQINVNTASDTATKNSLQKQINTLDSWLNEKIDNNTASDTATKKSLQDQITYNSASDLATKNSLQNQVTDNKKSADSSVSSLQNQINLNSAADAAAIILTNNKISTMAAESENGFANLIDTLNRRFEQYFHADSSGYEGGIVTSDGLFTKLMKGQTNRLINVINAVKSSVESVKTGVLDSKKSIDSMSAKIKDYTTLLTTLNATNLLNTVALNDFKDVVVEEFRTLLVGIEGLKKAVSDSKYDDNSFKTYINGRFSAYFTVASNFENGIDSTDGIFSKLIKGQFTRLMNDNFLNLEVFNKALTDNLRAEFKLLNDWFALVVDWLDMLYEKPSAVFEGALFDYQRLQEMLDGISFGNVVNEAGTNLWDVLQELISVLGGVVESVLSIVPDLIEQLIALIIPENPNFFSEDINSLIDSFDSKFEWTGAISESFTAVFSQPKSIKSLTIPIAGKQYKVVPDFVDLALIKTILTGYFCFLTILTTYRRIVGSGDIVQ